MFIAFHLGVFVCLNLRLFTSCSQYIYIIIVITYVVLVVVGIWIHGWTSTCCTWIPGNNAHQHTQTLCGREITMKDHVRHSCSQFLMTH